MNFRIKELGWLLLLATMMLSIPTAIWWSMNVDSCTRDALIHVNEAVGALLMGMMALLLPYLITMLFFIYVFIMSVGVLFAADVSVKKTILLFYVLAGANQVFNYYYSEVCASMSVLIGQSATELVMIVMAFTLILYKSPARKVM